MNPFLRNLVDDLYAFANDMLESGLAPKASLDLGNARAPGLGVILEAVGSLCALVPVLIDELEESESPDRVVALWGHSPVGATPSRHPADFERTHRYGVVPTRWVRTVPVLEPDTASLSWLAHLIELQRSLLESVRERAQKQIDDARIARAGSSPWALADAQDLESMERRLDLAALALRRAASAVARANGRPPRPSARVPSPYPRSRAWVRLRQMARDLVEPGRALPQQLRTMLSRPTETADLPYLYQRWCGVMLLRAFEELGWRVANDPVGPLLLGGCIRLGRGSERIDLWVEARITPERDHPCGFYCVGRGEVTPDFLLVTKGPSRLDAFVLDATMTDDHEVMLEKGKYLSLLRSARPGYAAGLEVFSRPRRSWAAAPIPGGLSRIIRDTAEWGVVPMSPARWRPAPLRAWVLDIDRYTRAWAHVEDDPRFGGFGSDRTQSEPPPRASQAARGPGGFDGTDARR